MNGGEFGRVIRRLDPRAEVVAIRELTGGVSATVVAVETRLPDGWRESFVIRRYGTATLRRNPHVARDEFRVLRLVTSAGVPVPTPYLFDESGHILPTPYLVTAFVAGRPPQTTSDLVASELAAVLAAIHRADLSAADLSTLPDPRQAVATRLSSRPDRLDEPLREVRLRTALQAGGPPRQVNASVLLHGDFWPGNTLWQDRRLVAVVDWEDVCLGDPLVDVANCRLELVMLFGWTAMAEFTDHYRSLMPGVDDTDLAYWDLWAALRPAGAMAGWGLDAATLRRMRTGHRAFVDQALAEVSPPPRG